MSIESMSFWLPEFVIEVQQANEDSYLPDSVYGLCCGLHGDSINIFSDARFTKCCQVLDSYMRNLKSTGNFEKKGLI